MASKFRYVPDVAEAKRIVDSGELGDVVLFENAFASRVDMSSRWNSDPAIGGGGVLIDNGTHSLDLARHLLGPLAKVLAVEGARQPGLRVEDTVTVFVRSERGVIGTIDLSWTINKELDRYVSLFGTRGKTISGATADAYSLGLMIGAGNGLLLAAPLGAGTSEEWNTTVLGGMAPTAAAGFYYGHSVRPTRGQVSIAGTMATMGIAAVGLGMVIANPDIDVEDTVLVTQANE